MLMLLIITCDAAAMATMAELENDYYDYEIVF